MELSPLGVGFLGAGPVTQAIHLPTLARLSGLFTVTHISDVNPAVAGAVAARVGARASTSAAELLDDPAVDVVAICSPHQFHAAQVMAACRAGKRAVLCEKPFAMTGAEASEIATVAAETGVPILVGAMHTFDPGWEAAVAHWGDLVETAHTIRSSIVLPPNPRFEDLATELIARPDSPRSDLTDPQVRADMVRAGVMGLAIHDLPLVRALLPQFADLQVLDAAAIAPFGYHIWATVAGRRLELHAAMTATWRPEWIFEAFSDDKMLRVEFTPSYVQAGSAVATVTTAAGATTFGPYPHNGYEGEWRRLAAVVRGTSPVVEPDVAIDDLRFALAVADAAADLVVETAAERAG